MPVICPSVLAATENQFKEQMERVAHFAHRIQIDLTDGQFAEPKTIGAEQVWWPAGVGADIHLMYGDPENAARTIAKHHPHMLIVHAEAGGSFEAFAEFCHQHRIKVGIALLQKTPAEAILHKPELEIGWDGGVNDQNISQLAFAGVDVFNVGGFIQKAENPEKAFNTLERIADETGET
jgi:ribulose-phosphate 3-epimerase